MQGGWIRNIVADFCPITTNEAFARRHHCLAAFTLVDEPALRGRVSAETIVDFLATFPVWLPSSIINLLVRRSIGRRRVSRLDRMFLIDCDAVEVVCGVFLLLPDLDKLLVPTCDVPAIQLRLVQLILILLVFWAPRLSSLLSKAL